MRTSVWEVFYTKSEPPWTIRSGETVYLVERVIHQGGSLEFVYAPDNDPKAYLIFRGRLVRRGNTAWLKEQR
jgi:hypothetical protein